MIMAYTSQKRLRRAFKEAAQFRLSRNRRSFKKLKELVEELRADPFARVDVLVELQSQLIKRILRAEKGLRIIRAERSYMLGLRRNRPTREMSDLIKKKIGILEEGIEQGRHFLWVLHSFGDAIPFIYHDKYALKHVLYSVEDYAVKQSAGFLYGNEGFNLEKKIMRALCGRGIPAVLCDITNTLRYGDICVMSSDDPYPIEVKSSENQDSRTIRQAQNLAAIHAFFSEDSARNFRGSERVQRREFSMASAHVENLKSCLDQSQDRGWAINRPEDGVTYLVIRRGADIAQIQEEELGNYPDLLIWNQAINSEHWMPYYPFTLTIRRAADLTALLEDRLVVAVAIDAHAVMKRFADLGFIATFVQDESVAIKVRRLNESIDRGNPECGVSVHLMRRIQFECDPVSNLVNFAVDFIVDQAATGPYAASDVTERDAQMMEAWRALLPMIPPLLCDDLS